MCRALDAKSLRLVLQEDDLKAQEDQASRNGPTPEEIQDPLDGYKHM